MNIRTTLAISLTTGLAAVASGLGIALGASGHGPSSEKQALGVAEEFFRTINAREFPRTCELMSRRFYKENRVPSKERCILGLTVGLGMSASVRYRILGARVEGDQATVTALANGAPGRIVLVKEHGAFRIQAVQGS